MRSRGHGGSIRCVVRPAACAVASGLAHTPGALQPNAPAAHACRHAPPHVVAHRTYRVVQVRAVDESGLVLRDYYWEKPEVALFKCVDDVVCMASNDTTAVPKHQCEQTCHPPTPPEFLAADAVDFTPTSVHQPTMGSPSNTSTWKAFAQVWGEPWCRENCTQITTQVECEEALPTLESSESRGLKGGAACSRGHRRASVVT